MAYANTNAALGTDHGMIAGIRAQLRAFADRAYRRSVYIGTARALTQLNDRQLADLGLARHDIARVAKEAAYGN